MVGTVPSPLGTQGVQSAEIALLAGARDGKRRRGKPPHERSDTGVYSLPVAAGEATSVSGSEAAAGVRGSVSVKRVPWSIVLSTRISPS